MRFAREAGSNLVRFGRGRATRYAWRSHWPGLDRARFPLFQITRTGAPKGAGELVTLAAGQSLQLPDGEVQAGLPVQLFDARPSGFLGRYFAGAHPDLGLPPRLSDWSDHHILLAMSRRGDDLPGDIMIGEESFARWQNEPVVARTRDDYPVLAAETLAGHPPGSSAGGERPKFGVCVEGRQVLVKYASRGAETDVIARRWCDLIVLEALALGAIASCGLSVARTAVIETSAYFFLESERFDRVGERGRVAVLSLAGVHDNLGDPWARAARLLQEGRRISEEDARRLRWLDAFGALIGNTDRHHHNVVFFTEGKLQLAPAFDQLPMFYAPTPDGQVPSRVFTPPKVTPDTLEVWDDARAAALDFWERASTDSRLSSDARAFCAQNARPKV